MRAIFYAPIANPDATAASGVQRMGTLLQHALKAAGVEVLLPSLPRTYDGRGNVAVQREMERVSEKVGVTLIADVQSGRMAMPDLWFSYHVYYKSPDWMGPKVARALQIPYLIAEGSHAPKRASGPWALAHDATTRALMAADRLLAMTRFDRVCLDQIGPGRVRDLKPFIDPSPFVGAATQRTPTPAPPRKGEGQSARVLAVGMMRNERKRASFSLLAQALRLIGDVPLELTIVGDGAYRKEVEAMFRSDGSQHLVRFVGAMSPAEIPALMASADVFAWPGLGEAYGLVFLEAQAAGLPVVACSDRGVPDAVREGETGLLSEPGDAVAYAANLRRMLADASLRERFGRNGRAFVQKERSVEAAAGTLRSVLAELGLT